MFILIILLAVLGLNLVLNWYWPVSTEFDAVANYDYRARVFFDKKQITGLTHQYLVSYPLFTSLGHTAMYTLGFENPKPFYSFLLWGFVLVFYARSKSLIACLLLITTPSVFHFASIAYTNFPYLVYQGGAMLYLVAYLKKPTRFNLLVFSLMISLTAWVRPAHLPFFLVNWLIVLVYSLRQKHYFSFFLPLIIYLIIYLPWYYFQNYLLHIPTYESVRTLQGLMLLPRSLNLLPFSIQAIFRNLTDLSYAGLTGWLFITLMGISLMRKVNIFKNPYLIILFINVLVWIFLCLVIRPEYPAFSTWYTILYDSMRRLFIIMFPLIILVITTNSPKGLNKVK